MAQITLYAEDICRKRPGARETELDDLGYVELTALDVNIDRHLHDYNHPIKRHNQIRTPDFQRFLRTGRPPAGSVLIEWQANKISELRPISSLQLCHRYLTPGDTVKNNTGESTGMRGTVIAKQVFYDLSGLSLTLGTRDIKVLSVPANEVEPVRKLSEGNCIIFRNWFGIVRELWEDVAVSVDAETIVWLDSDCLETDSYHVGLPVEWSRHRWNDVRFAKGSYSASLRPKGLVMAVNASRVRVHWMFMRTGSHEKKPAHLMNCADLNEQARVVRWGCTPTHPNAIKQEAEETYLNIVRFKDPNSPHINQEASSFYKHHTGGFDMNYFEISNISSRLTVRWEDLSISTHLSTDLLVDLDDFESEYDILPGHLVIPDPGSDRPRGEYIYQTSKIGVVQEMSAAERFAKVIWNPNAVIKYMAVNDEWETESPPQTGCPITLRPGPRENGFLEGSGGNAFLEEISLYDITSAPRISKRIGDLIMIIKQDMNSVGQQDNNDPTRFDWIGKVVETRLDGMLVVRVVDDDGSVKDIEVSPDNAILVLDSREADGLHNVDSDEDDSSIEAEDQNWMGAHNGIAIDVWAENDQGVRIAMDADSSDAENWETDEYEDDETGSDVDMLENDDIDAAEETMPVVAAVDSMELDTMKQNEASAIIGSSTQPENIAPSNNSGPAKFELLEDSPPEDHAFLLKTDTDPAPSLLRRIVKEHQILLKSLPDGIYVRSWESRLDLVRVLLVGPVDTPYEYAPFVIDLHLHKKFPAEPPTAHFHSWVGDGNGSINPNLYEMGKVCLSLLNTWHSGKRSESWNGASSSLLQVVVSILGLVLVREPYYNEAGFDVLPASSEVNARSEVYSEKTYFRSRRFITHAIQAGVPGMDDVVHWLYLSRTEELGAPNHLSKAIEALEEIVNANGVHEVQRGGLSKVGRGAIINFKRELERLKAVRDAAKANNQ